MSVVIPLYGEHRARSRLTAVTEAWLAQEISCEVVLVTAGEIPVVVAPGREGDRQVRVLRAGADLRAPGLLRNIGAARARSPLLYLSDADVAPLGRDYLTRALRLAEGRALAQPWMHRLAGEPAPLPTVDHRPPGSGLHCFVTAEPDGTLRDSPDEELLWKRPSSRALPVETPRALPPPSARDPDAPRAHQWRAPYHWGALLLRREDFAAVGGYCPQYAGWGSEDDDLLVKVAARVPLVRGWQADTSWRCLHFEHPVPYLGSAEQRANGERYAARLAAGAERMIAQDRQGKP